MSSRRLRREQYLLSIGVTRILDERYADLVSLVSVRQMFISNLRNHPLSPSDLDTMNNLILSLYHGLVTGSKEFPSIPYTIPSLPTDSPPGMMVPPVGPRFYSQILTPLHLEKADIPVLKADRRNCVRTMDVSGLTVTRVTSAVYRTEDSEMANRWRVTDYNSEGSVIMSVLCQFLKMFAQDAKRDYKGRQQQQPHSTKEAPQTMKAFPGNLFSQEFNSFKNFGTASVNCFGHTAGLWTGC